MSTPERPFPLNPDGPRYMLKRVESRPLRRIHMPFPPPTTHELSEAMLNAIELGDLDTAESLLPHVYRSRRKDVSIALRSLSVRTEAAIERIPSPTPVLDRVLRMR